MNLRHSMEPKYGIAEADKLCRSYLYSDFTKHTRDWESQIILRINQLSLGIKKGDCLLSVDDVTYVFYCGYLGWKAKHDDIKRQWPTLPYVERLDIETETKILLELYNQYWDYFCMFQKTQLHLLETLFCQGYSMDQMLLLFDGIDVLRHEVTETNRSNSSQNMFIPNLLLDMTIFLIYTNLLVHLVNHGHEELLNAFANQIVEPVTHMNEKGEEAEEIVLIYDWLKAYALLLPLYAKMKKRKSDNDQAVLDNLMHQTELRFDNEKVLQMFDFSKEISDLSTQHPSCLSLHSGLNQCGYVKCGFSREINWYRCCISYFERMQIINGGD